MKGTSEPAGDAPTIDAVGEQFEDHWRPEQTLDDLARYLPPDDDPTYLPLLVELACRDLERRLQVGQPARAEHYLERFPALTRSSTTAVDLIATEYRQRHSRERDLDLDEYRQRFPQFATDLSEHLQVGGPVIPGHEVLGVLGRGGMGVVYKSRHLALNRVVALKVILAGQHVGPEAVARLRAEAESAAALQHPNIVQIFEVGEHDGLPFLVLEHVAGGSLAEQLHGTPWGPRRAAALVEVLARALDHAHQAGIVHRDLKPGNVLLAGDGTPKLADFGLAKHVGREGGLTETGAIVGTAGYMAPEQARGKSSTMPITPLTDVYGLGATLYELLTGRPPFQGPDAVETLMQVVHEEPVPPRRLQPKVPRDLETICLKCLQKEPARRYASAAALAEDLGRFLRGEPIHARPVGPAERWWRWAHRNPLVAGLLTAVLASLVLGAAVATWLAIAASANADRADRKATEAWNNEQKARAETEKAEKELQRSEGLVYAGQIALALRYWEDGDAAAAWHNLGACRKELQGWEHDYLANLFNRNQQTFGGHTGPVFCVAFNRDGRRMVSGDQSAAIGWDVATGQQLVSLRGPEGAISSAAFSPDEDLVVTGGFSDPMVRTWNVATGQELRKMRLGDGARSVAFLPDGKRIVGVGWDGTMRLWDAATGNELRTSRSTERISSVAFRADGKQLVCGSGKLVKALDAATGEEVRAFKGHDNDVRSVAVSADGKRIVSTDLWTVKLWDATTGREVHTFTGPHTTVSSVGILPDGNVIAWGGGNKVVRAGTVPPERSSEWALSRLDRNWFRSGNLEVAALGYFHQGHRDEVTSVAFHPDGKRIASSSRDGTVRLWGPPVSLDTVPLLPAGRAASVAFSRDRELVVTAGGVGSRQVKIWSAATGRALRTLEGHPDSVMSVAVSGDGEWIVSACFDGTVKLWEAATGRELPLTFKGGPSPLVAISPDGNRIACGSAALAKVKVLDRVTGAEVLMSGKTWVSGLAFSPESKWIAGGCAERAVKVWDSATGEEVLELAGQPSTVRFVGFSPDGKQLVSCCEDGTLKVWLLATGEVALTCQGHISSIINVEITPDGKRIVSGSRDGTVKLWDSRTGQEVLSLKGPSLAGGAPSFEGHPVWVAVSPDGNRIVAVSGQGAVSIWDGTGPQGP
jgi:WD40 repeat protein